MKTLKLINGWCRLFIWSNCPECNADAPKYYDCEVCNQYHLKQRYARLNKRFKKQFWKRFKESLK